MKTSPRLGFLLSSTFALTLGFGCGDGGGTGGDGGDGGGGIGGGGGSGDCAATLADLSGLTPTTHSGAIDTDTAWAAADSPHLIEAAVLVRNATLTIEPCAVVLLDADVRLSAEAGGTIVAAGTADAPILFAGNAVGRWDFLGVDEAGALTLAHVTISGGGADLGTYDGATIVVDGPTDRPYVQNLEVQNVTITDSAGYGVLMGRHAAFVTGSTNLVISGAGADDASHPSPLRIDAQALGSVPDGSYTGNAIDRIEVDPFVDIEEDATISDHGVPYWISNFTELHVARPFGDTGAVPLLTIEAGVTLAFEPGTNAGFQIGGTSNPPQPGSLAINGTVAAGVTLTSAAASPVAGDWPGLVFATGAGAAGTTQEVSYTTIEYAGADNSATGGILCFSEDSVGNTLDEVGAMVISDWAPAVSFLHSSVLQHSLGWGVVRGWDTSQGGDVDFATTNTFLDLVACEQNEIRDVCPGAGTAVVYDCAGTI